MLGNLGIGEPVAGSGSADISVLDNEGLYDKNGHQVAYSNGTAFNKTEGGHVSYSWVVTDPLHSQKYWVNETDALFARADYPIYNTPYGADVDGLQIAFSSSDSWGILALIFAVIGVGAVVGLRILGNGISETSVSAVIKGGGLLAVWAFFSLGALSFFTVIPLFGLGFYFFLTVLYGIGTLQQIGGAA